MQSPKLLATAEAGPLRFFEWAFEVDFKAHLKDSKAQRISETLAE